MEDKENKTLDMEQLEEVSGGNEAEYNELVAFIHQVDPDYKISSEFSVMDWLDENSGLKFKSQYVSQQWNRNEFKLVDKTIIRHDELMKILREKYFGQAE